MVSQQSIGQRIALPLLTCLLPIVILLQSLSKVNNAHSPTIHPLDLKENEIHQTRQASSILPSYSCSDAHVSIVVAFRVIIGLSVAAQPHMQ